MKYIVYITINRVNGKVYVGVHKTENPNVFDGYLGCGVRVNSYKSKTLTVFGRAVNKYGVENFTRHVLVSFDNEDDAYDMESLIVNSTWVQSNKNYNTQLGGTYGESNPRNEVKVYCYTLTGEFLNEFKSITLASVKTGANAKSIRSCADGLYFRGGDYKWSFERYKILPESNVNPNITKVYQYDREGTFIKTFDSMIEAARAVNAKNTSSISNCASGRRNEAHGYRWSYLQQATLTSRLAKNIPVLQYTLGGEFLQEYESALKAAESLGKSIRGNITSCCTGMRKCAGGFTWKYKYDINKIVI
jgi:hypothetical protein